MEYPKAHLRLVESRLIQIDAVRRAFVQQVSGQCRATAVIDLKDNKPVTLSVIAEILDLLSQTFGGQQTPLIELGTACICVSDLKLTNPNIHNVVHNVTTHYSFS